MYAGLAHGEFVRLGQTRGPRQVALVQGRTHLGGGNLWHPVPEVMLAHERFRLGQNSARAVQVSLR